MIASEMVSVGWKSCMGKKMVVTSTGSKVRVFLALVVARRAPDRGTEVRGWWAHDSVISAPSKRRLNRTKRDSLFLPGTNARNETASARQRGAAGRSQPSIGEADPSRASLPEDTIENSFKTKYACEKR